MRELEKLFFDGNDIAIIDATVTGMRSFAKYYNQYVRDEIRAGRMFFLNEPDFLPEMFIHKFGKSEMQYAHDGRIKYFHSNWEPFNPKSDIDRDSPETYQSLNDIRIINFGKTNSSMYFVANGPLAGIIINRIPQIMALRWSAVASGEIKFDLPEYDGIFPVAQILKNGNRERIRYGYRRDKADVLSCFAGHSNRFYYGILSEPDNPSYGSREEARKTIADISTKEDYKGYESNNAIYKAVALVAEIEDKIDRQTHALNDAKVTHHDLDYNWCISFCDKDILSDHIAAGGTINTLPPEKVIYNPLLKIANPDKYETIVRLIDLDAIVFESDEITHRDILLRQRNLIYEFNVVIKDWLVGNRNYDWLKNKLASVSLRAMAYCETRAENMREAVKNCLPIFEKHQNLFASHPLHKARFAAFLAQIRYFSLDIEERLATADTYYEKQNELKEIEAMYGEAK